MKPGIIPAYAGSTQAPKPYWRLRKDHPRVCGEHDTWAGAELSETGSSPRMRGAPFGPVSKICRPGIIPAYAGSTHHYGLSCRCRQDHPRVCGEHVIERHDGFAGKGSSPRMRGAPWPINRCRNTARIIPAYAGSTTYVGACWMMVGDHPRVCGEHYSVSPG